MIVKLKETLTFITKIKFTKVKNNESILIFGISRGGTTLLAETLVALFNARLVWEPLFIYRKVFLESVNPFSTHRYNNLKLGWNPYVDSAHYGVVDGYFKRLFKLKERNIRFYRYTDPNKFASQEHTVFKFCFGNFMYPYFNQNFGLKSIVLLRHPFAIAASALNFGNNFSTFKKNYAHWKYSDTVVSGGFLDTLNKNIHLVNSAFTLMVYQVVTQFNFIFSHFNSQNTIIVYYEDLMINQEAVFNDIEMFFDRKFDFELFKSTLSRQSFSSQEGHMLNDTMAQLSKWKQKSPKEEIEQGLKIFQALDFKIYSDEILPLKSKK